MKTEISGFIKVKIRHGDQTQILLYFLDENGSKLVTEYRFVSIDEIKDDMPKTIIKELLKGPNTAEYVSAIPSGTELNSIVIDKNRIIVDLSGAYSQDEEDSEKSVAKIYSIVNSLTEIKEVEEVQILVDGKEYATKSRL